MYKDRHVAVVVPAFNVAAQILSVLCSLPEWVDEVIVVDDASVDETGARPLTLGDKRIRVLRNPTNLGVGGATVRGFRSAIELQADIVVKIDGDGQMDAINLERLIEPLVSGGYGYTKGNRFLHSRALRAMPKIRLVGNFAMTFLTKLASGYWHVFDPQNGYIAIRGDVLRELDLDRMATRYFFENDMLVHLNILNQRVKDVPMPAIYDGEPSYMKIHRVLLSFPVYLVGRFWRRVYQKYVLRDFSPIALFLFLGMPLVLWGVGFGTYAWWRGIRVGIPATAGTVMVAVLPFLVGFELLLQALILDIQQTPR